ncbi:MAG: hypothetical protein ACK4VP_08325 [Nitrospira sp.]
MAPVRRGAPRANNQAAPSYNAWKLYQNVSLTPLLANRWYQVRIHVDTSGPQGTYELWRREQGQSTWTKLAEWLGGVTPQFEWAIPVDQRGGTSASACPPTSLNIS